MQQLIVLVRDNCIAEALRPCFAEEVDDAIARDAEKPSRDMLDWHQQTVRFHQRVENILKNVLSVAHVGYTLANEVAQADLLPLDYFRDTPILFGCRGRQTSRLLISALPNIQL